MLKKEQIRQGRLTLLLGGRLIFAAAIVLVWFAAPGYSQSSYILLVQQTPVDGGTVSPLLGIHNSGINEVVTITATAATGYQFLYWLGDVGKPNSSTTTVVLDGPKIIVAIFERIEYELTLDEDESVQASLGQGGLMPAGGYFGTGGGGGGGGGGGYGGGGGGELVVRELEITEEPIAGADFPVPVPEPTSAVLFAAMGLAMLRRKRKKQPGQC